MGSWLSQMIEKIRANLRPLRESVNEYARGSVGGLLFSLPLLYTMEIWWAGFLTDPGILLLYVGLTFLLLLGYNRFAGMREDSSWLEVAIDSIEEMGIGLVLAAVVLFLLGRLTWDMPLFEILGKIVVESMTVAVGVSVGTAQLGGGGNGSDNGVAARPVVDVDSAEQPEQPPRTRDILAQLVLAFCGAVLFASNVAPTEEILVIGIQTSPLKLLGLVVLSLLTGAVVLVFSGFIGAQVATHGSGWFYAAFAVITSYAAALIASALMLWFFQRLDGAPLAIGVAQIVVLAFPAMLGASAGRVLIQ